MFVFRFISGKPDKRSEYIEILIPEFCTWHKFPSVYWLKALMLPTILYRLDKLLLAEDLLVKINSMCNIEVKDDTNSKLIVKLNLLISLFYFNYFFVSRRCCKD